MDTNTELFAGAARGEREAWNALVDKYRSLVWSVPRSFRLAHADAADVYQSTWLGLAEHLHRIREPEKVATWLVTTATRHSKRVVELRGREEELDRWEPASTDPGPEEVVLSNERHRSLWHAWSTLDERCRWLLRVAAYAPELTYREIAQHIGLAVDSVGQARGRCLMVLRRRLGGAS
jgi:RNA polymerase sigma factor (sigma-70 family)